MTEIIISVTSALILALLTYSARKLTQMYESQKIVAADVKGLKQTNLTQSDNLLAHCKAIGHYGEAMRGVLMILKAQGANGMTNQAFDEIDAAKHAMAEQDERNKKIALGAL